MGLASLITFFGFRVTSDAIPRAEAESRFATKESVENVKSTISDMKSDVSEIRRDVKTLLRGEKGLAGQ